MHCSPSLTGASSSLAAHPQNLGSWLLARPPLLPVESHRLGPGWSAWVAVLDALAQVVLSWMVLAQPPPVGQAGGPAPVLAPGWAPPPAGGLVLAWLLCLSFAVWFSPAPCQGDFTGVELGIGWKTFPPALRLLFWPQTVTTTQSIPAEALALLPSPVQQCPLATPGGRILGTTFFPRLTLGFLATQTTTYVTHHPSLPTNTCTDLQQLPPGGHLSPLKTDGAWLSSVPVQRWRGWAAMPGLGLSAPRE